MLRINGIEFPNIEIIRFNELLLPKYQLSNTPKMTEELTDEDMKLGLQLDIHAIPVNKDGTSETLQKLSEIVNITDIEIGDAYHTTNYKKIKRAEMFAASEIERLEDLAITISFTDCEE